MTQQEFFERTGIEMNAEEFEGLHRMYMATGAMDKDVFCDAYKTLGKGGAKIAAAMTFSVEADQRRIKELLVKIDNMDEDRRGEAEFLIGKAHVYDDTDLYRRAVMLVGQRDTTLITLKLGLPLFEKDIEYINENLQ